MARAQIILDTSIIIDLAIGSPNAIAWSQGLDYSHTAITIMEVLAGARNSQEMATLGRELSRFHHIHILREDSQWAVRQFRTFWLSHQIGIADCLIAAVAARTQLPVYTLNLKDFEPLPNVQVSKPY